MDLSIVIPVYNSEKILQSLVDEVEKNLKENSINKELIFVNDCSMDNSWEVIKKIKKEKNYVKGINLLKNYGQHNAIAAGLSNAKGNYIVLMDDDLQHDPIYIKKILSELKKGYDACYVKYIERKHGRIKIFLSWLNHLTSSFLSDKSTSIYTSSFKGFNKKICKKINEDTDHEVFLDWLIINNSKSLQSIEVLHRDRFEGQTNYNFKKLLILWSNMILKIKTKKKIKKYIVGFLKLIIKFVLFKILNKKEYSEKFLIKEKIF